jgi:hypothetical protein
VHNTWIVGKLLGHPLHIDSLTDVNPAMADKYTYFLHLPSRKKIIRHKYIKCASERSSEKSRIGEQKWG